MQARFLSQAYISNSACSCQTLISTTKYANVLQARGSTCKQKLCHVYNKRWKLLQLR